jgi:anti-sigma factor RsiW
MNCPDLEKLYFGALEGDPQTLAHLESCPACAEAIESHRQLEKDLFRIQDPLPPVDLVSKVMARVEAAPQPVRDVKLGVFILVAGLMMFLASFLAGPHAPAVLGTHAAGAVVFVRQLAVALGAAVSVIWQTAAFPLIAISGLLLAASLLGLRRLAGNHSLSEAKVS